MINTWSTKSVIREELVPEKYRQKLAKPVRIIQFDEILVFLTHCINNESIKVEKQKFNLPLTFISPVGSYAFILGLNFLKSLQGFLFINPNIEFFKRGITITERSNIEEAYKSISIEDFSDQDSYYLENSKENDELNNIEELDEEIFEHEYPILEEGTRIEI